MGERPSKSRRGGKIDAARIAAAREGPPEARQELLEACRRYLLKAAERSLDSDLRPKIGASDLVQESIIAAERDFDKFEGTDEKALFAWLTQILDYRLKGVIRKYKTQKGNIKNEVPLDGNEWLVDDLFQSDSTPSAYAIAKEEEQKVQSALSRLSERHRRVIQLRNWERMKFEEIGAELGISADAAGKLWAYAIEKLRGELRNGDGR